MLAGHIVFEQLGIVPIFFFFQTEAGNCAKANFLFLIGNFLILLFCQETKLMSVAILTQGEVRGGVVSLCGIEK